MADVTLSPFPYNGGLTIQSANTHMCRLTSTRFFAIYGQHTPSYTIGEVFTVSDVTAASPTVSVLRTQVISGFDTLTSSASSGFRVLRMNDTDVLVQQQVGGGTFTMRVVRIDASTNVMTQVGNTLTVSNYSADSIYDTTYASGGGVNPGIDNVCLVPTMPAATSFSLLRVTWDTGTSTLASSAVVSLTGLSASPTYSHCSFNKNRAGTKWTISYSHVLGTFGFNTATSGSCYAYIGDPASATSWTQVINALNPATYGMSHLNYLALTDTTGLIISDHVAWRYWNGSTLGNTVQFGTYSGNTSNETIYTTWLDQNHFLVETVAETNASSYNPATGRYVSVCKYTDPTFGEITSNTASYATNTITTSNMGQFLWHNAMRDRFNDNTILYFTSSINTTITTSTQFRVRALYAAP